VNLRDLKPGTRFALEIERVDGGLRVVPRVRIGNAGVRDVGPAKIVGRDEDAWIEIEKLSQNELAQLGRDRTK
jgi:hypothetical protein